MEQDKQRRRSIVRMKTIASTLEKSGKTNQSCMIKLNEVNSSAERVALKIEIARLRLKIDGSYANLKLAQDALRKSITAAKKTYRRSRKSEQHSI